MEHIDVETGLLVQVLLTILGSLIASSGFWIFASKKLETRSLSNTLLTGLAHDRIIHLGLGYIQRGSISQEEYENLYDCLFKPYEKLGGNGSAKRVMDTVTTLPIRRVRPDDFMSDPSESDLIAWRLGINEFRDSTRRDINRLQGKEAK